MIQWKFRFKNFMRNRYLLQTGNIFSMANANHTTIPQPAEKNKPLSGKIKKIDGYFRAAAAFSAGKQAMKRSKYALKPAEPSGLGCKQVLFALENTRSCR